jgi:hypothetical protein
LQVLKGIVLGKEKQMRAEKSDEASRQNPEPNRGNPGAAEETAKPENDRSRTGEGTGASGGGSIGNLPGQPVTGGSAEFGPREGQSDDSTTGEGDSDRNDARG